MKTLAQLNRITGEVIGSAIEVHRHLGPGLLESSYRECLCRELLLRSVPFEREKPLPLEYKGIHLGCGGLLINFNVAVLRSGIRRRILGYESDQATPPEESQHDNNT